MKKLTIPVLAAVGLTLASCSSSQQLVRQTTDDMYGSEARAQVVNMPIHQDRQRYMDYGNDYGNNAQQDYPDDNLDYDFDYGYASRINRFGYGSPYRSYYDNWYTFAYDPWMYPGWAPGWNAGLSFNMGFGWGWNNWAYNGLYSPWAFYGYGYPMGMNFWGPVSYYGWGWPGYAWGGGLGWGWGNGLGWGYSRPNNPRPNMGNGNPNYGRRPGFVNTGNPNAVGRGQSSRGRDNTQQPIQRPVDRPERPTRMERPERSNYPTYTPNTSSGRGGWGGGNSGGGFSRGRGGSR